LPKNCCWNSGRGSREGENKGKKGTAGRLEKKLLEHRLVRGSEGEMKGCHFGGRGGGRR